MIEFVRGAPTDEEVAAILAALHLCHPERDTNGWLLAMRYPDLEIDDVRAVVRGGRVL